MKRRKFAYSLSLFAGLVGLWSQAARADQPAPRGRLPHTSGSTLPPRPILVKGDGSSATAPRGSASENPLGTQQGPGAPTAGKTKGEFQFGSYGRVLVSSDGRGGSGRDADIVAWGSRIDENNYAELELRRLDDWTKPGDKAPVKTYIVSTLAIGDPIFHANGDFDATLAVRNLYLEERGIGNKDLAVWIGSRMYRGDDIYLLNFWPLDNLNTVGAGVKMKLGSATRIFVHGGMNRVNDPFQTQQVSRPRPLNQLGVTQVEFLDRPRAISSLRLEHIFYGLGDKGGVKLVAYGEAHQLPSGTREEPDGRTEALPGDSGWVGGFQVGIFRGKKDTFVNLFFRHARGLAAYGEWGIPYATNLARTASGASETRVAMAANWEGGPVTVMAGGYFRAFRTSAEGPINAANLNEGIFALRPHFYFSDRVGIAAEVSYQAQQRAIVASEGAEPLLATASRFGVMPFLSPAGKGSYKRPHLRLIWNVTSRNDDARKLYPSDDKFARRRVEQFFGVGAEWWFNSSYL